MINIRFVFLLVFLCFSSVLFAGKYDKCNSYTDGWDVSSLPSPIKYCDNGRFIIIDNIAEPTYEDLEHFSLCERYSEPVNFEFEYIPGVYHESALKCFFEFAKNTNFCSFNSYDPDYEDGYFYIKGDCTLVKGDGTGHKWSCGSITSGDNYFCRFIYTAPNFQISNCSTDECPSGYEYRKDLYACVPICKEGEYLTSYGGSYTCSQDPCLSMDEEIRKNCICKEHNFGNYLYTHQVASVGVGEVTGIDEYGNIISSGIGYISSIVSCVIKCDDGSVSLDIADFDEDDEKYVDYSCAKKIMPLNFPPLPDSNSSKPDNNSSVKPGKGGVPKPDSNASKPDDNSSSGVDNGKNGSNDSNSSKPDNNNSKGNIGGNDNSGVDNNSSGKKGKGEKDPSNDSNGSKGSGVDNNGSGGSEDGSGLDSSLPIADFDSNLKKANEGFLDFYNKYIGKFNDLSDDVNSKINYIKDNGFLNFNNKKIVTCFRSVPVDLGLVKFNLSYDLCQYFNYFYEVFYFITLVTTLFFGIRFIFSKIIVLIGG